MHPNMATNCAESSPTALHECAAAVLTYEIGLSREHIWTQGYLTNKQAIGVLLDVKMGNFGLSHLVFVLLLAYFCASVLGGWFVNTRTCKLVYKHLFISLLTYVTFFLSGFWIVKPKRILLHFPGQKEAFQQRDCVLVEVLLDHKPNLIVRHQCETSNAAHTVRTKSGSQAAACKDHTAAKGACGPGVHLHKVPGDTEVTSQRIYPWLVRPPKSSHGWKQ